jgi:anti-sigma factor RsiW
MACEELENQIADYLENQLPPTDRTRVAAHLAGCADCRAFARQLEQLDAALLRAVKPPPIPATFKARLHRRIQIEPAVLSEAQRAERKRQLQAEYEAGLARLGWRMPVFPLFMRNLGYAAVVVLAGCLTWLLPPQLATHLAGLGISGIDQSLLLLLVAGAIFVAIGLAAAFPRRFRKPRAATFQGRYGS